MTWQFGLAGRVLGGANVLDVGHLPVARPPNPSQPSTDTAVSEEDVKILFEEQRSEEQILLQITASKTSLTKRRRLG